MPQVVSGIEYVASWLASDSAYAAFARTVLVNVALGQIQKNIARRNDKGPPPLNVTLRETTEPRHLIFGSRRTGGVLAFYGTSGSAGDVLWYVVVLAGHQVAAITDVWLDTERIANGDINGGNAAGGVVGGTNKFAGKVWIYKHLGTGAQTVDTNADSAFTEWTSNHRLRGCAYIVVKMQRDDGLFPTGAPNSTSAIVNGILAYDPRLDSTNGGSGTHRMDNPSTWVLTQNPVLHTLWYLTGGSVVNDQSARMVKYGLNEPYSRIDWPYWVAAANICDEQLTGANTTPAGDQYRYQCNGEFTCGETRRDILTALLASMGGTLTNEHGKWRIWAGAYDNPIHTLDSSDLYDDLEVQDTTPHAQRYNAVSATYVDANQQYQDATTILRTDSSYETQDGGEQIPKEIDLRAVTDVYQAQRLCEIELRRSRMQRIVKLSGALNLLKVAKNETLVFSHPRYSWTSRVFRCAEKQFDFTAEAGKVILTCNREDSGVYTDMVTADYTTGTSATDVFTNDGPSAPTSLTITTYPSTIRMVVGLPTYLSAGSVIELYEYTASTPFGSATKIAESRSDTFIIPYRDTTTRYYWVRVRDIRGSVSGTFPASTGQSGVADRVSGTPVDDSPADGNISYTAGTQPRVESAGLNAHTTYTAPTGVSVGVQISWTAQAQIDVTTSGVAVGYADIMIRVQVNGNDVFTQDCQLEGATVTTKAWGSLAGSKTFQISGGDQIDAYLTVGRKFSTGGASPAQTITWRAALLDLLPLKG